MAVADDDVLDVRGIQPEFAEALVDFRLDRVIVDGVEEDDALRRGNRPDRKLRLPEEIEVVEDLLRLGVPRLASGRGWWAAGAPRAPVASRAACAPVTSGPACATAASRTPGTAAAGRGRVSQRHRAAAGVLEHTGPLGSGNLAGDLDVLERGDHAAQSSRVISRRALGHHQRATREGRR